MTGCVEFPSWTDGSTYTEKMRSFSKAYEGELVAVGSEVWELRTGSIAQVCRDDYKFIAPSLGKKLMTEQRTGMPPVCAINGSFTRSLDAS